MTLWLALRRLLPLLAALSLALTPVTASAATVGLHASMAPSHHATAMGDHAMAGMDHAAMGHHAAMTADMADPGMDEMPCCPKAEAAKPDCGRDCPLMALCLASLTSLPPAALRIPTPVAKRASPTWPEPGSLSSVLRPPLPEPPRA